MKNGNKTSYKTKYQLLPALPHSTLRSFSEPRGLSQVLELSPGPLNPDEMVLGDIERKRLKKIKHPGRIFAVGERNAN